jgi:hypothetical protein
MADPGEDNVLVLLLSELRARLTIMNDYLVARDPEFAVTMDRRLADMLKIQCSVAAEDLEDYRSMVREYGPVRWPTLDELEQQVRQDSRRRLLRIVRPEGSDGPSSDPPGPAQ